MNGLTTIAQLPRSGGAGMELKGETNKRPKHEITISWDLAGPVTFSASLASIYWPDVPGEVKFSRIWLYKSDGSSQVVEL